MKYRRRHGNWRHLRLRLFLQMLFSFGSITLLIAGIIWQLVRGEMYWLALCVFPLLLSIAAYWTYHHLTRPLANVLTAAQQVASGDLTARVDAASTRDISLLIDTFNEMVTALDETDQQRRKLTADIAHELRTPLHILQGNIEGLIDGIYQPTPEVLQNLLNETSLLTHLVDDLQVLAQADTGQLRLVLEPLDINELVHETARYFHPQIEARGLKLECEVPEKVMYSPGDGVRLQQVLGNLLSNAIRHTPAGGTITLRAFEKNSSVVLEVQDSGEGIKPEDLPHLFDRFWRGTQRGSGLGLAIVRELVMLHKGTIDVQSNLGQGTIFRIKLPPMS